MPQGVDRVRGDGGPAAKAATIASAPRPSRRAPRPVLQTGAPAGTGEEPRPPEGAPTATANHELL